MKYTPLPFCSTPASAVIPQRTAPTASGLNLDSPAVAAMTNFAHECPVTVSPLRHIDDAVQDMIRAGVRALLVLEEGQVQGLITSYDIQGDRPILFLQGPSCQHDTCTHRDVTVADIMTPLAQMATLDLNAVESAHLGHVVDTFRVNDCTHRPVLEAQPSGEPLVRGLISRQWLGRQLGASADMVSPRLA